MAVLTRPSNENQQIIRAFQESAPINVYGLAKAMGLRVFSERLHQKISGKLYRDKESQSGWSISVNSDELDVRKRFTAAHEIGHFVLHKDLIGSGIEDDVFYRSGLPHWQETEANNFAADILMPWELINKFTDQGVNTPEGLAKAFNVSKTAMNIRLGIPT